MPRICLPHVAWLLLVSQPAWLGHAVLHAQSSARFQLVRCGPQRDAACLATHLALPSGVALGDTTDEGRPVWRASLAGVGMIGPEQSPLGGMQSDITPVFGAPVLPTSSLGRSALRGTLSLTSKRGTNAARLLSVAATWRPPMLALPAFTGVADSSALPAPVRDAIAAGAEPPSVRPLLVLVVALAGGLLVLFVPRFFWSMHRESEEDMARQVAASRALLSTQELEELRGRAPRESRPRNAEESTKPVTQQPPSR